MNDYQFRRWLVLLCIAAVLPPVWYSCGTRRSSEPENNTPTPEVYWHSPDPETLREPKQKALVLYGKDLIAHTARYFGPVGSIAKTGNGMNCQNCHLGAGTTVFGNNYGSVASLYPKFRARSGTIESIPKRINDCFERSLHARAIPVNGPEMNAIVAYMNFLGSNVVKGQKARGSGLAELSYLDRAANPANGKKVYVTMCRSCHQTDGAGLRVPGAREFVYPPLWGDYSYTDAAGLFRITNAARYIKFNMPQGITFGNPQLTDAEAWDVAAFINTQWHPHENTPDDWPDKSLKPVDCPTGPYTDSYSEKEHKYGPFGPIEEAHKKSKI
jgi:thiosulfate dehydrogenase